MGHTAQTEDFTSECESLHRDIDSAALEEEKLDFWIQQLEDSLGQFTRTSDYQDFAYLTYEDIKALPSLEQEDSETLLAIRAPPGTVLEAPDPATIPSGDPSKYQLSLRSKTGEILVYVVTKGLTPKTDSLVISTNTCNLSPGLAENLRENSLFERSANNETLSDLFAD